MKNDFLFFYSGKLKSLTMHASEGTWSSCLLLIRQKNYYKIILIEMFINMTKIINLL
jgi:hypothetical protein